MLHACTTQLVSADSTSFSGRRSSARQPHHLFGDSHSAHLHTTGGTTDKTTVLHCLACLLPCIYSLLRNSEHPVRNGERIRSPAQVLSSLIGVQSHFHVDVRRNLPQDAFKPTDRVRGRWQSNCERIPVDEVAARQQLIRAHDHHRPPNQGTLNRPGGPRGPPLRRDQEQRPDRFLLVVIVRRCGGDMPWQPKLRRRLLALLLVSGLEPLQTGPSLIFLERVQATWFLILGHIILTDFHKQRGLRSVLATWERLPRSDYARNDDFFRGLGSWWLTSVPDKLSRAKFPPHGHRAVHRGKCHPRPVRVPPGLLDSAPEESQTNADVLPRCLGLWAARV